MALSPAAQGAPGAPTTAEIMERLECDERSLTDDGEVMYSISDPPDYPTEYRSTDSPEAVAAAYVRQQRLTAAISPQATAYRSADRVDLLLTAVDGRTIGVVSVVDEDGWRLGSTIICGGE